MVDVHTGRLDTIAPQRSISASRAVPGLFLQFARRGLPSAATLRRAIDASGFISISHDFTADTGSAEAPGGRGGDDEQLLFELLVDGLTFDLSLCKRGVAGRFAAVEHLFDLPDRDTGAKRSSLRLVPGSHLSGAEGSMPVVRTQMRIAITLLGALERAEAVVWPPAASAIGKDWFVANTNAWLAGGPFPAPGLVTFAAALGGAIQSRGLAFLTGQELRIEGELAGDSTAATRLGIRLVDLLVHRGRLTATERLTGPAGEPIVLEPSTNGRFVRVWPG